ncbi:ACP S-malonyltransferase [Sorangium sp. So ce590]|uniref:ACP S-malonyltransferase n=1 Tax=Sorangium sp. So ce590 TaxID=3133317 RepID=UPI003F636A0F
MTTIYVFPGQGSQRVGMAADLFLEFPELVREADTELGYSIVELCTKNPDRRLGKTQYTQPAIYVANALHYFKLLRQTRERPHYVAGHSIGEYSALLAANVFDFRTGLRLVKERGELMSQVVGGSMAAIIGLTLPKVEVVLRESGYKGIDVANINATDQIVIAGPRSEIECVERVFLDAGATRFLILNVSGAFHSRYMKRVKDGFHAFLDGFRFSCPQIPVVANTTAVPYPEHDVEIKSSLAMQVVSSVRWKETVEYFLALPKPEFREVGASLVLTKLIQQMQRN